LAYLGRFKTQTKLKNKFSLYLLGVLFCAFAARAQQTMKYTDALRTHKEAAQFFHQGLYHQAIAHYDRLLPFWNAQNDMQTIWDEQARLNYRISALYLNRPGAEKDLIRDMENISDESGLHAAQFALAKHYFRKGLFKEAITYFDAAGIASLSNDQISARNFQLAYACLVSGQMERVSSLFASVKNIPGENFAAGNYYHGLMAYYQQNFAEARSSFQKISSDHQYKYVVPFYLTEMEYLEGRNEKAREMAEKQLANPNKWYYQNELNLLLAQIFLEDQDYESAEKWMQQYLSQHPQAREEDYFRWAYSAWRSQHFEQAVDAFDQTAALNGSLAQEANYLKAGAYLKLNKKQEAIKAFKVCIDQNKDTMIKEQASLLRAQLAYEILPFDQSENYLKEYLRNYPNATAFQQIRTLGIHANIGSGNFQQAELELNSSGDTNQTLKQLYQRAAYSKGLASLLSGKATDALSAFESSRKIPENPVQAASAIFWMAECAYRMGEYRKSIEWAQQYNQQAWDVKSEERTTQLYLLQAHAFQKLMQTDSAGWSYALYTDTLGKPDWALALNEEKPEFIPDMVPEVDLNKMALTYDFQEKKYRFAYTPVPLTPLVLDGPTAEMVNKHHIELAIGHHRAIRFRSGYDLSKWVKTPLYMDMQHQGFRGGLSHQRYTETELGIHGAHVVKGIPLHGALQFDRKGYGFYGYDRSQYNYEQLDLRQRFTGLRIQAYSDSMQHQSSEITYQGAAAISLYGDRYSSFENGIKLQGGAGKWFKRDLKVFAGILADLNVFRSSVSVQNNSLIQLNMGLQKNIDEGILQVALNPAMGQKLHLLPDIFFRYPLASLQANIEIGWRSVVALNTFRSLTTFNPFVFSHYQVEQSQNTEVYGHIKGQFEGGIQYGLKSGVRMMNNLPVFVNDTAGDFKRMQIDYEARATAFMLEADLQFQPQPEITAGTSFKWHPILQTRSGFKAWHYLPFQWNIFGQYNFRKDWQFNADLFLRGASAAAMGYKGDGNTYVRMNDPGIDLNLKASYRIEKGIFAYLELNNLMGSQYQRWYGYPQWGTQFFVGAQYLFNSNSPLAK
jgi:tetratricopeptide (TPR) repeat protein